MVENKIMIRQCGYFLLVFLLAVIVVTPVLAAAVIAAVDRNPVKIDESFRLVLTIKGSMTGEPNLDVLKKDFEILGRTQSSNFQIINGNMSRQTQFVISLMPRSLGVVTIPPIHFGADRSQAITMTVKKASASQLKNADVSLEVSINTDEVYLQEQLIVTVRLYLTATLANASLSIPPISGVEAMIEKLGDDSEFETQRNGVRVRVVERRYAVFPQQSGVMTIEPVLFNGQIVQASSRFTANPLFQRTRTKRLRSEPITITVRAIPAAYVSDQMKKTWLPARQITLTEAWPETPPVFKVGEPVTRTLRLTADGLMAAQLPDIRITLPAEFKHYSDQPVLNDQYRSTGIIGSRQQKIAIIPSLAGPYTLPAIKLEWWNTQTGRSETLQLPSRTIQVLAAEGSSIVIEQEFSDDSAVQKNGGVTLVSEASLLKVFANTEFWAAFWPGLSLVLLLAWLITFFMMRAQKKALLLASIDQPSHQPADLIVSEKLVLKKLQQACLKDDPKATKEALLGWARLHFYKNTVTSLADIATCSNAAVSTEVKILNQVLYSQSNIDWRGQPLWQVVDVYSKDKKRSKSTHKDQPALAPLYPR